MIEIIMVIMDLIEQIIWFGFMTFAVLGYLLGVLFVISWFYEICQKSANLK